MLDLQRDREREREGERVNKKDNAPFSHLIEYLMGLLFKFEFTPLRRWVAAQLFANGKWKAREISTWVHYSDIRYQKRMPTKVDLAI